MINLKKSDNIEKSVEKNYNEILNVITANIEMLSEIDLFNYSKQLNIFFKRYNMVIIIDKIIYELKNISKQNEDSLICPDMSLQQIFNTIFKHPTNSLRKGALLQFKPKLSSEKYFEFDSIDYKFTCRLMKSEIPKGLDFDRFFQNKMNDKIELILESIKVFDISSENQNQIDFIYDNKLSLSYPKYEQIAKQFVFEFNESNKYFGELEQTDLPLTHVDLFQQFYSFDKEMDQSSNNVIDQVIDSYNLNFSSPQQVQDQSEGDSIVNNQNTRGQAAKNYNRGWSSSNQKDDFDQQNFNSLAKMSHYKQSRNQFREKFSKNENNNQINTQEISYGAFSTPSWKTKRFNKMAQRSDQYSKFNRIHDEQNYQEFQANKRDSSNSRNQNQFQSSLNEGDINNLNASILQRNSNQSDPNMNGWRSCINYKFPQVKSEKNRIQDNFENKFKVNEVFVNQQQPQSPLKSLNNLSKNNEGLGVLNRHKQPFKGHSQLNKRGGCSNSQQYNNSIDKRVAQNENKRDRSPYQDNQLNQNGNCSLEQLMVYNTSKAISEQLDKQFQLNNINERENSLISNNSLDQSVGWDGNKRYNSSTSDNQMSQNGFNIEEQSITSNTEQVKYNEWCQKNQLNATNGYILATNQQNSLRDCLYDTHLTETACERSSLNLSNSTSEYGESSSGQRVLSDFSGNQRDRNQYNNRNRESGTGGKRGNNKRGKNKNREKCCFECGQDDHILKDCPNTLQQQQRNGNYKDGKENQVPNQYNYQKQNKTQEGIICYKCNQEGHISKDCPNGQKQQKNTTYFKDNQENMLSRDFQNQYQRDGSNKKYEEGNQINYYPNQQKSRENEGQRKQKKGNCFQCGQDGHIQKDCPQKLQSQFKNNQDGHFSRDRAYTVQKKRWCGNCGDESHSTKYCTQVCKEQPQNQFDRNKNNTQYGKTGGTTSYGGWGATQFSGRVRQEASFFAENVQESNECDQYVGIQSQMGQSLNTIDQAQNNKNYCDWGQQEILIKNNNQWVYNDNNNQNNNDNNNWRSSTADRKRRW